MIRFTVYSLFLFLLTTPGVLLAQHTLSGRVVDAGTGTAIPNAELFNETIEKTYRAGRDGRFEMEGLEEGTHHIHIFSLGYEVVREQIEMEAADRSVVIELRKISREMREVAVREQREQVFAMRQLREVEGTSIYAGRKSEVILMDQIHVNLSSNRARQIYSQVAGLNIYDADAAGLQLHIGGRGLDPNRSANFNTRQNGYDISADVLGYPESYYTPPAEALFRIQMVRGAASLQYGTQFGGLVNFILKKPDRTTPFALTTRQSVGSDALYTSFNSVSGQAGPVGYYGYLHYKRGDGFRPNSGFDSWNAYTYTDFALSDRSTLALELTYLNYLAQQPGGLTDVMFYEDPYQSNRERNWFRVDWRLAALKLEHEPGSMSDISLTLFGLDATREALGFRTNRVSQVDDPSEPRDLLIGRFVNWGAEARYLQRYQVGSRSSVFLVGAKYYQSSNQAIQGPGPDGDEPDFNFATEQFPAYPYQSEFDFPNLNMALFGENIFYLRDNLSVTPGLRFEYIRTQSEGTYERISYDLAGNPIQQLSLEDNRTFDRTLLLGGVGLSYLPRTHLEFYGNISQNYRSVTFNDIRVVNPTFQVDPEITDERGFTADLGLRGRLGDLLQYDMNGFTLLYDRRLGEVLRAETRQNAQGEEVNTGRIVRFRGNIGKALMTGVESLVDLNLGEWLQAGPETRLSLFVNTAITHSRYLESEVPGVEGNQVEFIPMVNLKSGLRFGYENWTGRLQYTYLSLQYTDASNAEQNRMDNQSGIRGTVPAYDVLDLSLSWTYRALTLESGIDNLLNEAYFTRRATGYPGPGILPSAPRTWYLTLQLQL